MYTTTARRTMVATTDEQGAVSLYTVMADGSITAVVLPAGANPVPTQPSRLPTVDAIEVAAARVRGVGSWVFAVSSDRALFVLGPDAGADWTNLSVGAEPDGTDFVGVETVSATVIGGSQPKVLVVSTSTDGLLMSRTIDVASGDAAPWVTFGGAAIRDAVAAGDDAGAGDVFALGQDQLLYRLTQTSVGGAWPSALEAVEGSPVLVSIDACLAPADANSGVGVVWFVGADADGAIQQFDSVGGWSQLDPGPSKRVVIGVTRRDGGGVWERSWLGLDPDGAAVTAPTSPPDFYGLSGALGCRGAVMPSYGDSGMTPIVLMFPDQTGEPGGAVYSRNHGQPYVPAVVQLIEQGAADPNAYPTAGIRAANTLVRSYDLDGNEANAVFRTRIQLPPDLTDIELHLSPAYRDSQDEAVVLTANGQTETLQPGGPPLRLQPNIAGRIVLEQPAANANAPALIICRPGCAVSTGIPVFTDVDLHRKIGALAPGALASAGSQLGSNAQASVLDAAQSALQNLVAANQYTYRCAGATTHHDRYVQPAHMADAHWKVEFGDDGSGAYSALTADQVATENAMAKVWPGPGQSFLGKLWKGAKKIGKIVVHTAEKGAQDVAQAAEHIVADSAHSVVAAADDIVHGDFGGAAKDVYAGVKRDLTDIKQGGEHLGADVLEGAEQALVVTMHIADDAYQFLVHHTGVLGEVIDAVVHQIGVGVGDVLTWLAEALPWNQIRPLHDEFLDVFGSMVDEVDTWVDDINQIIDRGVSTFMSDAISGMQNDVTLTSEHLPKPSAGIRAVEWIVDRLIEGVGNGGKWNPASSGGAGVAGLPSVQDEERAIGERVANALIKSAPEPSSVVANLRVALDQEIIDDLTQADNAFRQLTDFISSETKGVFSSLDEPFEFDIPILSKLYEKETGRKLSIAGFAALAYAVVAMIEHETPESTPSPVILAASTTMLDDATGPQSPWRSNPDDVRNARRVGSILIALSVIDSYGRVAGMAGAKLDDTKDSLVLGIASTLPAVVLLSVAAVYGAPEPDPFTATSSGLTGTIVEPEQELHMAWSFGIGSIVMSALGALPLSKGLGQVLAAYQTLGAVCRTGFGVAYAVLDDRRFTALRSLDESIWELSDSDLFAQLKANGLVNGTPDDLARTVGLIRDVHTAATQHSTRLRGVAAVIEPLPDLASACWLPDVAVEITVVGEVLLLAGYITAGSSLLHMAANNEVY